MSYAKLWKVCQDYALGIGAVNAAKTNLDAFKTSWSAEHGSIVPASITGGSQILGDPYNSLGTHNTPHVPRGMVRVKPAAPGGITIISQPEQLSGIVAAISRLSTGVFHIAMDARLRLFFGDPQPAQGDNTVTRFCQPYGASLGGGLSVGLVVNCYDLQAGDFVLTDFEFSCGVYSYS